MLHAPTAAQPLYLAQQDLARRAALVDAAQEVAVHSAGNAIAAGNGGGGGGSVQFDAAAAAAAAAAAPWMDEGLRAIAASGETLRRDVAAQPRALEYLHGILTDLCVRCCKRMRARPSEHTMHAHSSNCSFLLFLFFLLAPQLRGCRKVPRRGQCGAPYAGAAAAAAALRWRGARALLYGLRRQTDFLAK